MVLRAQRHWMDQAEKQLYNALLDHWRTAQGLTASAADTRSAPSAAEAECHRLVNVIDTPMTPLPRFPAWNDAWPAAAAPSTQPKAITTTIAASGTPSMKRARRHLLPATTPPHARNEPAAASASSVNLTASQKSSALNTSRNGPGASRQLQMSELARLLRHRWRLAPGAAGDDAAAAAATDAAVSGSQPTPFSGTHATADAAGLDAWTRILQLSGPSLGELCQALGFVDFDEPQAAALCVDLASLPADMAAALPATTMSALLDGGVLAVLLRIKRGVSRALSQALTELGVHRPHALCEAILAPLVVQHRDQLNAGHRTVLTALLGVVPATTAGNNATRKVADDFLEAWLATALIDPQDNNTGPWTDMQLEVFEEAVRLASGFASTAAIDGLLGLVLRQAAAQQSNLKYCKLLHTLVRQQPNLARNHVAGLKQALGLSKVFLAKSALAAVDRLG